MSTRDWVLVNEVGWGMPHGAIAMLAAIGVAARWVGLKAGRPTSCLNAREGRRDRAAQR